MRQILRNTARLLWRHWPTVAAVLLASWTLHYYGLELAAEIAVKQPVLGWAFLPIAILLFIGGYALVFRVVRGSLPSFVGDPVGLPPVEAAASPARVVRLREEGRRYLQGLSTLASAVVLPFFVMWSAWGFLDDDMKFFASEVIRRFVFLEGGPDFRPDHVPIGWLSISILLGAYVARLIAENFQDRLPFLAVFAVYFEVLWVFLLAIVVFSPLRALFGWIAGSALWADITDWWYGILQAVEPIRAVWRILVEPLAGVVPPVLEAFVLPIAWFALVGIVIGRPLSQPSPSKEFLDRHPRFRHYMDGSAKRWRSAPGPVRDVLWEFVEDILVRFSSLWAALRALQALGPQRVAFFILASVLLRYADAGLTLLLREIVGPQQAVFWLQLFNPLLVISWIVPETIRVCLVASAYDAALGVVTPSAEPRSEHSPHQAA